MADALPTMNRNRKHIAVLCLDVDKFKDINDASDIATGDAVLREMGARIRSILRSGDFVARRSGDEFAIALVDINNLAEVMAFTNRLMDTLRPSFRVADKEFLCTTSVGIAFAPSDGDTAAAILRHADIALARAKSDGGQRVCFFEPSMEKALQRRRMIEHELRRALAREEFEVAY
ncbi:MAG: GGDEF domain-containing protein, partial [Methyloceanibacter sp.]